MKQVFQQLPLSIVALLVAFFAIACNQIKDVMASTAEWSFFNHYEPYIILLGRKKRGELLSLIGIAHHK